MKKIRIIVLAVIVALSMAGAGYAAWGTQITDTTKLGMADWKVVLEQDSDWSYYGADNVSEYFRSPIWFESSLDGTAEKGNYDTYIGDLPNRDADENYVYTLEPIPDKDNVDGATDCTFEFKNLHPGTQAMTRFEIRNRGSIPAKIEDVTVDIQDKDGHSILNSNGQLLSTIDPQLKAVIEAFKVYPYFSIHRGTGNSKDVLMNGKKSYSLTEIKAAIDKALHGKLLNPADSVKTVSDELESGVDSSAPVFTFWLPSYALGDAEHNDRNVGMNQNFRVYVDFHFVQYNDVTRK